MELSPPSLYDSTSSVPSGSRKVAPSDQQRFPTQTSESHQLDMYGYPLINSVDHNREAVQLFPPSTTLSDFSDPFMNHQISGSPPNILSADYDPFAPFPSQMGSSYAVTPFSTRSAEVSLQRGSPSISAAASHRSSLSSAAASETYSHSESYPVLHRRTKRDNNLDWSSDGSTCGAITAPQSDRLTAATSSFSYPLSIENSYFREQSGTDWPRDDMLKPPNLQSAATKTTSGEIIDYQEQDSKGLFGNVQRTRTTRKMTTREEANYQCKVKGCGKLFSRSYNYKAHLETHDSSRAYPFPCPLSDCNKKFVRKTDLQRHHQSVHMKERNYCCDFCNRYFARKDTLRRHMEDGCSKRFDLALGYKQNESASQEDLNSMPNSTTIQRTFSSTSNTYNSIPTRPPSTLPESYTNKADLLDNDDVDGSPWSN